MQKWIACFFDDYRGRRQTGLFKRLLYGIVILKCLGWLWHFDLLFGSHSIVYNSSTHATGLQKIAFFLHAHPSPKVAYGFLFAAMLASIMAILLPRVYFFIDALLWWLLLNLHWALYPTLTGGDYLLNQFLFFNCFLAASYSAPNAWLNSAKTCLHNMARLGIMLQLCLAYFLSGLAKCPEPAWLAGHAVNYVAQVHQYALYAMPLFPGIISKLLTWAVLLYQLSFPIVVWLPRIKQPFLMAGIIMHLYIAFVMGLPMFGLVMIVGYVLFWNPSRMNADDAG